MAGNCCDQGKSENIPLIFEETLDLHQLYPHRKSFYVSEFIGFTGVVGLYYAHIGEREAAKVSYATMKQLEPRAPLTKRLKKAVYPPFVMRVFLWGYRLLTGKEFRHAERTQGPVLIG